MFYLLKIYEFIQYYYMQISEICVNNFYLSAISAGFLETEIFLIFLSGKKKQNFKLFLIVFVISFLFTQFNFLLSRNISKRSNLSFIENYEIGKKAKETIILQKEKINNFLIEYENKFIIFIKFIPGMPFSKTLIPIILGTFDLKYFDFFKYSLISSFLWSGIYTFIGYFLKVETFIDIIMIKFTIFILILFSSYLFYTIRKRSK